MEQGVAARSGEVQLVPLVSIFSPLFVFFFCSSASTAPSYSPGKIFSKESDSLVHKAVWCVCVCVFVCVCYTAPT